MTSRSEQSVTGDGSGTAAVCYVALGSNVGDRLATLQAAVEQLDRCDGVSIDFANGVASLHETSPVGCDDGATSFLNTVVRVHTTLSPEALLEATLRIERALGRVRGDRNGPRTIDIDLLLYGCSVDGLNSAASQPEWGVLKSQSLTLPHPRMCERRFVLEPLAEIAAEVVHPVSGNAIGQLAEEAARRYPEQRIRRIGDAGWAFGGSAACRNGQSTK